MKPKIIIHGEEIFSPTEFHEKIADLLEFPDYYGKNWDALWDCLSGYIDTNINIIIKNSDVLKNNLGNDFEKLIEILDRLQELYPEFQYELS